MPGVPLHCATSSLACGWLMGGSGEHKSDECVLWGVWGDRVSLHAVGRAPKESRASMTGSQTLPAKSLGVPAADHRPTGASRSLGLGQETEDRQLGGLPTARVPQGPQTGPEAEEGSSLS